MSILTVTKCSCACYQRSLGATLLLPQHQGWQTQRPVGNTDGRHETIPI